MTTTAIRTSTLRPGLIVSLKSTITGNVHYSTRVLEEEFVGEDGEAKRRWETERTVADAAEHEAGKKARSFARNAIARVCAPTAFGLLCPEDRIADLEAGLAEAYRIRDGFNAKARHSRLGVYVMTGRVASDDANAVKAINSEVRELLAAMEKGIQTVDVAAIRDAADKARQIGSLLTPDAQDRVQQAVEIARSAARQIVKAGETAAADIDQAALAQLGSARAAFIDLDEAVEVKAPEFTGLALDLMPEEEGA